MAEEWFKRFCENSPLIAHNAKFEHKYLLKNGIDANIIHDTFLLAYLYDERIPRDLESLCLRFGVDTVFKEEWGEDVAHLEGPRLKERNARDARNTKLLKDKLWPLLSKEEQDIYTLVLVPAARTLAKLELHGVAYSPKRVKEVVRDLNKRIAKLGVAEDAQIKEFESIQDKPLNTDSPLQMLMLIYDFLGYEALPFFQAWNTDSNGYRTNPKTGVKILEKLYDKNPSDLLKKIIEHKRLKGWKKVFEGLEAYCDKCHGTHTAMVNGVDSVFTSLNPVAVTGRIISSHPNLLNLPNRNGGGKTRRVFIPSTGDKGCIVEADYSQLELRILAGVSGDGLLIDDFNKGKDQHVEMAKTAFETDDIPPHGRNSRDDGKTLNFAIPFGSGKDRIALETGRTVTEAGIWLERYWKKHKTLKKFLKDIPKEGIIKSVTGMKRHCTTWNQGKNYQTQNPGLIVLLVALNRMVDIAERMNTPMDLGIHDSVRFDVADKRDLPKLVKMIRNNMQFEAYELFPELPLPLTVDIKVGPSWGEMSDYED